MIVDIAYRISGREIAVDHGYAVFSALSRIVPIIHGSRIVGIHPIRGLVTDRKSRRMALTRDSRLVLRMDDVVVPNLICIAGETIQVGDDVVTIGVPNTRLIEPSSTVAAMLVVISAPGKGTIRRPYELDDFRASVRKQLDALGVADNAEIVIDEKRRTTNIAKNELVGYRMCVRKLSDKDSLAIQYAGIGAARTMGCGIFVPKVIR